MSADPEFQRLLDTLENSPNASERMQAAKALGDYVDELSDSEYTAARSALDKALSDPDPMVLTTAMGALTRYSRQGGPKQESGDDYEIHGDTQEDMIGTPQKAACAVCGRPEALIPDEGCDRDDCPYN